MQILLLLPLLIPLTTAVVSLLAWQRVRLQAWLALVGTIGLLVAALALLRLVWYGGIRTTQIGSWPAPYGITLVADLFSVLLIVLTGCVGLAIVIYSMDSIGTVQASVGYYPLLQILLMGVCGTFLTGDIFNLYVWFEVTLMASFVLLTLGGNPQQIMGAIKYVTINLVASSLLLSAIGILYGQAGTLNMADLALTLQRSGAPHLVLLVAILFLVAFGTKAAIFPLYFWLPASYHTPLVPVSALFAGLLTKVGIYALIRIFTLIFVQNVNYISTLFLILAGLTMIVGVSGAIAQDNIRQILSFLIISEMGYVLMGLGLYSQAALAGAIFFMIHMVITKSALFLVSGLILYSRGSENLKELGGLYQGYPGLTVLFLLPALSLAGMPPFSGFFAKLSLVRAGLELEQYLIVATALIVGLLTLYAVTRIWLEAFWKPDETAGPGESSHKLALLLPVGILIGLVILVGLLAEPIFMLSSQAAEQLLRPAEYIQAVLL
jgi:multicomponent Na+:H+ antiporter subunit D